MNNSTDTPFVLILVELLPNLEYIHVVKEARNLVNVYHKLNCVKIETHINYYSAENHNKVVYFK